METYKPRRDRMAQFRKSSLLVDLAVVAVMIAVAVGFALIIADLIWGPEVVTYFIADLIA